MELGTADQAAAKKFYTEVFGWTVFDAPMGPDAVYTMFKLDGRDVAAAYTLEKSLQEQGVPSHWMIYIATDNVDETARRATELGATVVAQPFDVMEAGRMAVVRDPAGAMFSLWQGNKTTGIGAKNEDGAFCWADLNTPDQKSAADFYSKLLGWQLLTGEHDTSGYLHIKNGEEFIGGVPTAQQRDPNAPPHWAIYFQAADCDSTVDKAKQAGARVYAGPMSLENVGRFAVVADPQGAVFSVFTSARKSQVA